MKKNNLVFMTLCDYALSSQDGKASAMGMFEKLFVERIPTIASSFFLFAIIEGEPKSKNLIEVEILKPSGKSLGASPVSSTFGNNGRTNVIIRMDGVPIDESGVFSIVTK